MTFKKVLKSTYRLVNFDYGSKGKYFITIVIKEYSKKIAIISKKDNSFSYGLTETGMIIEEIWNNLQLQFPHIRIDKFVIMPDHFHGIINICHESKMISNTSGGITGKKNPMLYDHTLGKIIRWFKAKSSFEIRKKTDPRFKWQKNYHDSILWNNRSLLATRKYIIQNPEKWVKKYLTI